MLIYIYGGTSSGKSIFGEELIQKLSPNQKDYLATMKIWDEESQRKVDKHRLQRADKHFQTIEVFEENQFIPRNEYGMLECLSNLVANYLFVDGYLRSYQSAKEDIQDFLEECISAYQGLVIIGNDIFKEKEVEGLEVYMNLMAYFHNWIVEQSDEVYRVVAGIEWKIKEKNDECA